MGLWFVIKQSMVLCVSDLMLLLVDSSGLSLESLVIVCWAIWRERCNLKHGSCVTSAKLTNLCRSDVAWAKHFLHVFQ